MMDDQTGLKQLTVTHVCVYTRVVHKPVGTSCIKPEVQWLWNQTVEKCFKAEVIGC